jgi:hypothetical protein
VDVWSVSDGSAWPAAYEDRQMEPEYNPHCDPVAIIMYRVWDCKLNPM